MRPYNPQKPLFSIHVPKCAGSSFLSVLKAWFGKGFKGHYPNERRNKPPVKHKLRKSFFSRDYKPYTCVHGHFNNARGTGVFDYYPEAEQFITILRDPFDLHLSNYFYVRGQFEKNGAGAYRSGAPHPIIANDWSVAQYLEACPRSYLLNFFPPDLTLDNFETVIEERFIFVGITEALQASVDQLANILGFESRQVPEQNVSVWNQAIPDGSRVKFEKDNPLEFAIYKNAVKTLPGIT